MPVAGGPTLGKLGMGLQFATAAYQVYILPVLSFLAQFKKPDDSVLAAEAQAFIAACLDKDPFAAPGRETSTRASGFSIKTVVDKSGATLGPKPKTIFKKSMI